MSDLPAGWRECQSKSNPGAVYYFNSQTGETQWAKPTAAVAGDGVKSVRCAHLLVKHAGSRRPASWKSPQITRSKEEARAMLVEFRRRITAGEVSFGNLAAVESDCSSAKDQGDLGHFHRGDMQKAFEDAAFALEVGQISDIVDSDSGLHIILRLE